MTLVTVLEYHLHKQSELRSNIIAVERVVMEAAYTIAPATRDELYLLQEIQSNEGWDPLALTYLTLAEVSPEGLFFGKLNGRVIATCMATKYSPKFGFLSVYWVDSRYRGKRYGIAIFERAMQILKNCDVVALDSVIQQIPNYQKWGFQVACNNRKRYAYPIPNVDQTRSTLIVTDKKQIDLATVSSFDQKCFPAKRQGFLKVSLQIGQPFVALDPKTLLVVGYAIVIPCESGYAIAPLMALSSQLAEQLIKEIFSFYRKKEKMAEVCMLVFTLDEKEYIKTLIDKYFPNEMYNCKRMYRMLDPSLDFDRSCVYATAGYDRG